MSDFALDLNKFAHLTEKKLVKVVKKSFIDLSTEIILTTPVDEGRLRANWMPAVNKFNDSTTDSTDERKAIGSTIKEANSYRLGDTLTLTNNLPYAQRIEDGYSKTKAPAGMVKVNILRWSKYVDENARKFK